MARVRGKNTRPEMVVRTTAHSMGLRYSLHRRDLKGTPDLVFPKYRLAIFVHGCFWHQHPNCKRASLPQTRKEFWASKLANNIRRDKEAIAELRSTGWHIEVIWECETKDVAKLEQRLTNTFGLER